uniref:Uncharacterized protein n=1 Tax=uncultured planctomycete 3FN TaxID=455066 RepID=A9LGV5_9BACT|nr:hypothetical protein 3FN_1 [uncultured planctomycete 3FN]
MSNVPRNDPPVSDASLSRRTFLKASALTTGIGRRRPEQTASEAAPKPVKGAEQLTAYQLGPHIWVRWNNELLTSYRAHPTQKYPYMYPLAGPLSGKPLTTETSLPYPHHRSLLFACDRVNGANYWQGDLAAGQIVSTGPKLGTVSPASVEILDQSEWKQGAGPVVMKDERKIVVSVPTENLRTIDWTIQWTAVEDVTVVKTNHSLFAIRAARDITPWGGGTLINSNGESGEKATFGKVANWCGYHGLRQSPDGSPSKDGSVEGIAVFDHPQNPWSPCPWFTRDYGFISPTPMNFLKTPWKLPAGKSVQLVYRVVLHAGTPEQAGLDDLHKAWAQ